MIVILAMPFCSCVILTLGTYLNQADPGIYLYSWLWLNIL